MYITDVLLIALVNLTQSHVHHTPSLPPSRGSRGVCLVLIEHGADIHLADADGDTPLMLAEDTDFKEAMISEFLVFLFTGPHTLIHISIPLRIPSHTLQIL